MGFIHSGNEEGIELNFVINRTPEFFIEYIVASLFLKVSNSATHDGGMVVDWFFLTSQGLKVISKKKKTALERPDVSDVGRPNIFW